MKRPNRFSFGKPSTRLGFEALEDRRLLAASGVALGISMTSGGFTQGDLFDPYKVTVTNNGTVSSNGLVTVTDNIPNGLAYDSAHDTAQGAGWTIQTSNNNSVVTATRSDPLAPGASYPLLLIRVDVANNAPPSITNSAQVSGGGSASSSADASTNITQLADMTVGLSHSGKFTQSDASDSYTINVSNVGNGSTSDTVTVIDTLPTGLTALSGSSGTGWNVAVSAGGKSVTATRSATGADALPGNPNGTSSFPPITILVSVASNAASSVTNSVQVYGGGQIINTNDTATDPTTITQATTATVQPFTITYGAVLSDSQLKDLGMAQATVKGTSVNVPGNFTFTTAVANPLSAGDYQENVTFTPTDQATYASCTTTVAVHVAKATPTVSVNPVVNITYGDTLNNGQLSGTVNVPGMFTYSATDVGSLLRGGMGQQKTVTFTPNDTTDYNTTTVTATINVAPLQPTIGQLNPITLVYGTALDNSQFNGIGYSAYATLNGVISSVTGKFTYNSVGTLLSAGSGQSIPITFTPDDTTDFAPVPYTATVNVSQATPTVLSVNPVSITSAIALDNSQLSGTAQATVNGKTITLPGKFSYTTASGNLPVGLNQSEAVTFSPDDKLNYTTAASTVLVNVAYANAQTPTLNLPAVSFSYGTLLADSQLQSAVATDSGGSMVPGTFTYTSPQGTPLPAGQVSESVTFTPDDLLHYLIATSTVTVNVSQATLTVTADAQTKVFGDSDPALTYSATGFQYSDNAGSVLSGSLTRDAGETVASYAINQGSLAANANYSISYSGANLVITPATPTVSSVNAVNIGYGTALANSQLSGTASVPGSFSYTTAVGAHLAAGNGQSENVTFMPTDTLDYNTASSTVTVNVSQATLTVTADALTKVFGDSDPALTYSATGFQYSDNAGSVLSGSLSRDAGETVASYAINQGSLAANANYTISYTGANLVITPATPTVSSVNAVNITYGTALANSQLTTGGTVTATVNGVTTPVPGTFTYTSAVNTVLLAGLGQTEGVTFTPTDTTDYNTASSTVTVNVSLALAPATLPAGSTSLAYSQTITASGGNSPYVFALAAGSSLPAGLILSTTGVLSGTPTAAGSFNFTITVHDAASPANTTSAPYQLTINQTANSSLAGFVYIDANNTGKRKTSTGQTKIGLGGFTVSLFSQNNAGNWVSVPGVSPIVTDNTGAYKFTGLAPANYQVRLTTMSAYIDGKDTAGTVGGVSQGTAGTDKITVQLATGQNGVEYNFGQRGIRVAASAGSSKPSAVAVNYLMSALLSSSLSSTGQIVYPNGGPTTLSAAAVSAIFAPALE